MRPLKFNFDKEDDLCIWKGNDESIAIYYKDIPSFLGKLKELVSGEIDDLFLDRKNWGVLKIEKKNAFYRIYANELEYDCDREDLKRLQNYLSDCIEKGSPIFLNDIPPEMDSNKIIIVANELDQPAARLLIDSLAEKYHSKAELWTSDKFFVEEDKIKNYKLFISVGGYNYNPVTKKYLDTVEKLEQTDEIYIGTTFRKAIIFCYQETESSLNAVKYFIKNNLDGFIKNNFPDLRKENKNKRYWDKPIEEEESKPTPPNPDPLPDTPKQDQSADTPKQPDAVPEVKPPVIVADPPADYYKDPKYEKEFYEIDDGIFKVKYYDEEALIKDSTPLQYCYYVLCRPHRQISLTEIFCAVNDEDPNYIAPLIEGAVIDKNINKTIVENLINDYNEKILLLERAKLIILQEEDALNGIFHDGDVDLDATKPTSKFDKEKERIKKAKELSLRYLNSMDRLERELEAYEDILRKLNDQLKYQPKEVSNERNRYASRIRMGFSNFYKLLKDKKLYRLRDYLETNIDVSSGYIYHPDDFITWKLTK